MSESEKTNVNADFGSSDCYPPHISPAPWRYRDDTGEVVDANGHRVVAPLNPFEEPPDDEIEIHVSVPDGKLIAVAPKAIAALRALYDMQNGCPLPSYEAKWNQAMKDATSVLNEVGG